MEQVVIKNGQDKKYDKYEDNREVVSFSGKKVLSCSHPNFTKYIIFTLYECPGGWRVVLDIDVGDFHLTRLLHDSPVSREEVSRHFPWLHAGVRDLDEEIIGTSPEKRERVVRFARIMRLVHSTSS